MGDVHSGVADLGLTTIGITAERFQHFDIFFSYIRRSYSIVVHEDNLVTVEATSHMLSILKILASYHVWAITFIFVAWFLVLGVISDRVYSRRTSNVPIRQVCAKWALRLVGTGLGFQGIEDYEKSARTTDLSISKISLFLTWQIFALIFLTVLMSRLPVIFTFGSPQHLPFGTPKELLDSNFTVYSTGTPIKILNASLSAHEQALSKRAIHLPRNLFEEDDHNEVQLGHSG
ncbi:hypothetical protein RvY_18629-2 [Ramazzottius varieornatus]|uniref:Ionotropic glutamate receptor C-terminal domain-containing protein n=1 Tax=Ramazzottius varieornatus TaxID=947166 RepID=A0A1D1WAR8_RAMVA|nr:hypothetical protein RvY_18629-2 [Ramazzottius varieornatus]